MAYTEAAEVIKDMTLTGLVAKLPPEQLDPKLYGQVKKQMEKIGGKWRGGKTFGFVFTEDPATHFERLRGGEKVNLKQEFQMFFTPDDVADRVVELADIRAEHTILEPEAGDGALVRAIWRKLPGAPVSVYELQDSLNLRLASTKGITVLGKDFLNPSPVHRDKTFDRIIANPPFTNNQDIDHVMRMLECLNPGGVLTTIMSTSWLHSSQKKQVAFREMVEQWRTWQEILPSGTFKESGTMIETVLIRLPHIPF